MAAQHAHGPGERTVRRCAPRSYQLLIEIRRPVRRIIGRLGTCTLAPGFYVYTGSARRGLEARIARHLRRHKSLRWHIDFVLAAKQVGVVGVRRSWIAECRLNAMTGGGIPIDGFGASDCRSGCGAHLKRVGRRRPRSFVLLARSAKPRSPTGIRWESH
ncbi:MAG: GIY-YIG nuclease family protein [Proteobacteria bacterium]|nr:GIY-YIG nuclease family protein [Pseudomonadota bacterium]